MKTKNVDGGFENQLNNAVHYNAIKQALANGNAAVMVGAGFSRNAINGESLATWDDIARELATALNPGEARSKFGTSDVLQLGEQYAHVFSKPALEDVIKRLVPDAQVRPGDLHTKLLELPWVELFTTNYDTLLERAAELMVEQAHYTVSSREDIPQSKILNRRRIVKLHGSFPSQRPFIFTEEEYRTYPTKFASFVNLVRQSLLENVFCLIGFSGDDPNFLHWIGWVRDVLDQHALPIYLFVGKMPSIGMQRLLQARCVTPVLLPIVANGEEDDYAARLELLFSLINPSRDPRDESWGEISYAKQLGSKGEEEQRSEVIKAYKSASALRRRYPGWLIAPAEVRKKLLWNSLDLLDYLSAAEVEKLSASDPFLATAILSEFVWLYETLLQSLPDDVAKVAVEVLKSTVIFSKEEVSELEEFSAHTKAKFSRRWKELSIGVLRWSRQGLHRAEFDELSNLIESSYPSDSQVADEITYERILLSMYEGDRALALKLLSEWEIRTADGYMYVRKGILMSELGLLEGGHAVSLQGLQKLRLDQRSKTNSTKALSEEAWACLSIRNQTHALRAFSPNEDKHSLRKKLGDRLTDLAAKGHDVRGEVDILISELASQPRISSGPGLMRTFDRTWQSVKRSFSGGISKDKIISAFSWLTLTDRVALPPRIGNVIFEVDTFSRAAWWAQYADSNQRVLSVLIRTLNKKLLDPVGYGDFPYTTGWLSRYQVARTEERLAINICEKSLALIERILNDPTVRSTQSNVVSCLSFHLEVFGRLVMRVEASDLLTSYFNRTLNLHRTTQITNFESVWRDLATALTRVFSAMPIEARRLSIPEIWAIVNSCPEVAHPYQRQDWVSLLAFTGPIGAPDDSDFIVEEPTFVKEVVSQLDKATEAPNKNRQLLEKLWQYIYLLDYWKLIGKSSREAIGKILWSSKDQKWPTIPGFYRHYSYQWLPKGKKPSTTTLQSWILEQKIPIFPLTGGLTCSSSNGKRSWGFPIDNHIFQEVTSSLDQFPWKVENLRQFIESVKAWWDSDWEQIEEDLAKISELAKEARDRLDLIDKLLFRMMLSSKYRSILSVQAISKWVETMVAHSSIADFVFLRYKYAVAILTSDLTETRSLERAALEKLVDSDVFEASKGQQVLTDWIKYAYSESSYVPHELLRNLLTLTAFRKMPGVHRCLGSVWQIVLERPNWLDGESLQLIDMGLEHLWDDLSYTTKLERAGISDEDVPDLRYLCTCLSISVLKKFDSITLYGCRKWASASAMDPLPEVRHLQ